MRRCDRCSTPAEPDDRFCGACGQALPPREHDPAGRGTETSLSAAEVNARLGRIYLARGKREEAARAWRRALELRPDDPGLAERLAELERAITVDRESP